MSQKRQILIDTALDLFYKNGINSIGINEILNVSGVAKRTLYSQFQSKEELVLATLQQRHTVFMAWLEQKLSGAENDRDVIDALFSALGSWFCSKEPMLGDFRGCFFINTSAEFSESNTEILRLCRSHKHEVRELIARQLKSEDPLLLDMVCMLKEGAIITAGMGENGKVVTEKCIALLDKFAD